MPIVLIIEDDVRLQRLLKMLLQQEGYRIYTAENGRQALELCETLPPDLILLDLMLPVMDGPDFLGALDERGFPHVPVIACTAQPERLDRYDGSRVVGTVTKPFDPGYRVDFIEYHLRAAARR